MFFTGFSGDFDGEFSLVFHGGNAMKSHEKSMKKPLKIQRFMTHEKTKSHENATKYNEGRLFCFMAF